MFAGIDFESYFARKKTTTQCSLARLVFEWMIWGNTSTYDGNRDLCAPFIAVAVSVFFCHSKRGI